MNQSFEVWSVLLLACVAANLPFFNQRWLAVGPLRDNKTLAWRLAEWLVMYGVVGLLAMALEAGIGQNHAQGWEFYAVTLSLFATFAFPGFVWQYLLRRRVTRTIPAQSDPAA